MPRNTKPPKRMRIMVCPLCKRGGGTFIKKNRFYIHEDCFEARTARNAFIIKGVKDAGYTE